MRLPVACRRVSVGVFDFHATGHQRRRPREAIERGQNMPLRIEAVEGGGVAAERPGLEQDARKGGVGAVRQQGHPIGACADPLQTFFDQFEAQRFQLSNGIRLVWRESRQLPCRIVVAIGRRNTKAQ